jgi:hypothetical protein
VYWEAVGRVLWAIERNARDGSIILLEVAPPGPRRTVYRSVYRGALTPVAAPGRKNGGLPGPGEGPGRAVEAGQCFASTERRLDDRGEMWVSVLLEGGEGPVLWVAESAGGVVSSVVEVPGVEVGTADDLLPPRKAAEAKAQPHSRVSIGAGKAVATGNGSGDGSGSGNTPPAVPAPSSPAGSPGDAYAPAAPRPSIPPPPVASSSSRADYDDELAEVFSPPRRPKLPSTSKALLRVGALWEVVRRVYTPLRLLPNRML